MEVYGRDEEADRELKQGMGTVDLAWRQDFTLLKNDTIDLVQCQLSWVVWCGVVVRFPKGRQSPFALQKKSKKKSKFGKKKSSSSSERNESENDEPQSEKSCEVYGRGGVIFDLSGRRGVL